MSQAKALYHLQTIELAILRGQKRLEEIARALDDDAAVQTAQKRVTGAENSLRPARGHMRDLEMEIQSNLQKAESTEKRLYSGTVNNPKELQDMQQEIVSLKKWHGELENRLLEAMVAVEEAEASLNDAQEALKQVTAHWEIDHQDLLAEKATLEEQVSVYKSQHVEALKPVTPESLKTYKMLKPRKANQPVAALNARTCAVCGIEQTRQVEQDVQRNAELIYCQGCERILVVL